MIRGFGGAVRRVPIYICESNGRSVVVRNKEARDAISGGMSGALLVAGGKQVRMLLRADTEGDGIVIRLVISNGSSAHSSRSARQRPLHRH